MAEVRKDGFVAVGSKCGPFEHEVGIEELNGLRSAIVETFFAEMPKVSRSLDDNSVKVACAKAFHERDFGSAELAPSVFGAAILRTIQFDDPEFDAWHLRIGHNRTQRARHNNAPQRIVTRMKVEVFNDQVVEAVKEVKVIRGVGELTPEAIEQQLLEDTDDGHIVMQRRAYERYMTSQDCDKAAQFLGQIARRTASVG